MIHISMYFGYKPTSIDIFKTRTGEAKQTIESIDSGSSIPETTKVYFF